MANPSLFSSLSGRLLPAGAARNDAGAPAYGLAPRAALAQLAATGCLTPTYYAGAETQLDRVLELARRVDVDFLARTALYSRRQGFMKDMPALLCAVLATRDLDRLAGIFPQVIDNGRMLRNFVQIVRSGVTGRKSLGSAPKRLVRQWLEAASDAQLLAAAVGSAPSLADIVKMVHPAPQSSARAAFYAWLIGKPYEPAALPPAVRAFEAWKEAPVGSQLPAVPFQLLTAQPLGQAAWTEIAWDAGWTMTRMNLNTFARHGVFADKATTRRIATRLRNGSLVRRARAFPYQLMVAFQNAGRGVPTSVRDALQDAMEVAIENVPRLKGSVVVCPDVSGSMQMSVSGYRRGATSKVRCVDVAALVTAALVRRNPETRVVPFTHEVQNVRLNARDTVMTNAEKLAKLPPGATDCAAPLVLLNKERARPDLVVLVSDNESWVDAGSGRRGTKFLRQWEKLRQRHPKARLVCLDIVPNTSTQAMEREDILNIGGFSDSVFKLLAAFAGGSMHPDHWIGEIEKEPINMNT